MAFIPPNLGDLLSRRELRVVALAARGDTDKEIADKLEVSIHTVRLDLARIYAKLGARNRTHAVTICFVRRLLALPAAVKP